MRTRLVVTAGTAALALAGSILGAAPAFAACGANATNDVCSAETDVTFSLTSADVLKIETADATAPLGAFSLGAAGATVAGDLPATTVTDGRSQLAGTWAVSISSTNFTHDTVTTAPAILASGATASTDLDVVAANNTAATAGGTALVAYTPATTLAAATPLVAATLVQGYAVTSYTPAISITVPPGAVAGAYSGTVTQTLT